MTQTDGRNGTNPSILAIGQLALHRETIEQLTGGTDRRYRSGSSGTVSSPTCYICIPTSTRK